MSEESKAIDEVSQLRDQKAKLLTGINYDNKRMRQMTVFAVGFIVLAPLVDALCSKIITDNPTALSYLGNAHLAGLSFVGYAVLTLTGRFTTASRLRTRLETLQDLNLEIDLARYNANDTERRAEKLLQLNQNQLKRYYDLNIRQNLWIFIVGIVALVVGTALMCSTAYLVLNYAHGKDEKVIVAVLGGVGGLLTNFVAFIYLKMHSAQTDSLVAFHERLIHTQELMLANLLAAGIGDSKPRWAALHEMACNITKHSDSKSGTT